MPIESIDNRRLYRQIADQIVRLIENGEYPAGSRLPAERLLATQLNVSRPTVREALIALEVEGWVEIRGGAGVQVLDQGEKHPRLTASPPFSPYASTLPPPGPFEVLSARELVEPEVAALAARFAGEEQIVAIGNALGQMVCCSASDPRHVEFDHLFHFSLAEATGNGALVKTVEALWALRMDPLYIRLQDHFHNESIWQRAILEHREIFDAVRRGEAHQARTVMRRHLKNARSRFVSNWIEN